jgi:putative transposase
VRFSFIESNIKEYPVRILCKTLQVSVPGFYSWKRRDTSHNEQEEYRLARLIEKIHLGSRKNYGSPRIHAVLKGLGESSSKSRIERIMRKYGIRSRTKRKFRVTTDSKHKLPIAENILSREFNPEAPNLKWAGDITYIWTKEGWMFLAVVMDLYSRRIVGWSMGESLERQLVLNAQTMAIQHRGNPRSVLMHSDRGSQYASRDFQSLLKFFDHQCSMSRKGNCWDNSVVESFFKTLKSELVYHEEFETREQARQSIFEWIECDYNRQRVHSSLGYRSPEEYERLNKVA